MEHGTTQRIGFCSVIQYDATELAKDIAQKNLIIADANFNPCLEQIYPATITVIGGVDLQCIYLSNAAITLPTSF